MRVRAAGLNRADVLMRDDTYVPDDAGWSVATDRVGFEFSGEVVESTGEWSGRRLVRSTPAPGSTWCSTTWAVPR